MCYASVDFDIFVFGMGSEVSNRVMVLGLSMSLGLI